MKPWNRSEAQLGRWILRVVVGANGQGCGLVPEEGEATAISLRRDATQSGSKETPSPERNSARTVTRAGVECGGARTSRSEARCRKRPERTSLWKLVTRKLQGRQLREETPNFV